MKVTSFTKDDCRCTVDMMIEAWKDAVSTWSDGLLQTVCEYSLLDEYINEQLALKICDNDGNIKGVLFAATSEDDSLAEEYIEKESANFSLEEKMIIKRVVDVNNTNNAVVKRHLGKDDAMLTLFLSNEKGCGKMLLQSMFALLKEKGYKRVFLWTDTKCNHSYYPKHGFDLVEEYRIERLAEDDDDILTFIYKKDIE